MGGAPVLGGHHLKMKRDNQPKDGVGGGGGLWRGNSNGRNAWGRTFAHRFGWRIEGRKKKKIERAMGPPISMAMLNGETQQPTESRQYRSWSIFGRGGAQGEDDLGGRRQTFSAFELRGKKINKTKFVMALEGRQSMIPHNNQPDKRGTDEGVLGLVVILDGSIFYVTVTFSFLLVYDTSKKKVVYLHLKSKTLSNFPPRSNCR
jgi:hypothetical protein